MTQYIDKTKIEEILRSLWKKDDGNNSEHRICYNKALQEVQCQLDTIEEKESPTDVFIKKVEDYLNSQLYDWVSITNPNQRSCANVIPKENFIEDFKKYMKGKKL